MKFGKYIQSQQTEWGGPHYLNYKGLKKIINSLQGPSDQHVTFTTLAANNPPGVGGVDDRPSQEYQALKTAFFFKLERELEKVNAFYLQKEAELKVRLRSLVEKKRILQSGKGRQAQASLGTLKEGFVQFQRDLTKLQNFVEVNATGFRKILKKWDKRSKSSTKELYLSRQVEIQPCFNNDVLAELTDQATTNVAELDNILADDNLNADTSSRNVNMGESIDDVESDLTKALRDKNPSAVAEYLAKRGTPLSGATEDAEFISRSFLRFCTEGNTQCLEILLASKEVDCNFADDISGRTCLHELVTAGRQDVLQKCVQHGANIEATDVYGRTPLHYAAMYGRPACAIFLLQAGAKVHAIDHDGCMPLVYSITAGHTKCVEILIDNGAVVAAHSATAPIPLSLACQHGHKDIAMLLLSKGAQLTANAEGLFPLHLTCREGHHEISQLLINHGADVNARDGFNGWTPIFYAAAEGHLKCVQVLLSAGCDINVTDEHDWSPWTYALYRGHMQIARLLELKEDKGAMSRDLVVADDIGIKPMAPSGLFFEEENTSTAVESMDLDELPDLALPPPIIPFRIYGHAFLDKRHYVQIAFRSNGGLQNSPVSLFGSQQLSSLKMVISSKPEVGIPYSVILPLQDDLEVYTFLVEDLSTFSLQFDVFPSFGTKPIGRGVALSSQLAMTIKKSWSGAGESEDCIVPLFDSHLRVVGELNFGFAVVKPFVHPSLQIGGKVETYWKTTKVVGGNKTEGVHSFITASSLAEEYIQVIVQMSKDGVPVIYPEWSLPVKDLRLGVGSVPFTQARTLFNRARTVGGAADIAPISPKTGDGKTSPTFVLNQAQRLSTQELANIVYDSFLSLQELLMTLPSSVGVSIVLKYPTSSERPLYQLADLPDVNTFVDAVLQTVYDQATHRSIIFMSFNPSICTAINWKQPNYGVFFGTRCGLGPESNGGDEINAAEGIDAESVETDRRCNSIKEAIRFAKSSNLLGVVCEATPLVQVPILIKTIKESGLILATCGPSNNEPANVRIQEEHGADAIIVNNVFRYNVI